MSVLRIRSLVCLLAVAFCIAVTASSADAAETKDVKQMRGPLDRHAVWVQEIVNALELPDAKRAEVKEIIDEGHAAWRKWFEANHEKVAAHNDAVRIARDSGDKAKLADAKKKKKVFMHTAPSIFRHPEPVREALPETSRAAFDAALKSKIKEVHTRPPARTDE